MRADLLLVRRQLAPSRTAARRHVEAGQVHCDLGRGWQAVSRPGQELPEGTPLRLLSDAAGRYVSRGGLKMAGALAHTGVAVEGLSCLDVGQSTGGFTDCLLQAGAARVVGVDVGHGQLHPRLHADPRVACLEGVNARHLGAQDLGGHFPAVGFVLIVADVSFISLALILPRLPPLLAPAGRVLALVKPQFEVGPDGLGKGGLVRSPTLYPRVEERLRSACEGAGLTVLDWFDSPITGGDGNREFFLFAAAPGRTG